MCYQVTCKKCGKATWKGCGQHVDQVMRGIPRSHALRRTRQRTVDGVLRPTASTGRRGRSREGEEQLLQLVRC